MKKEAPKMTVESVRSYIQEHQIENNPVQRYNALYG